MEYYIDGHNLIPNISGISLTDENDENELLERLQEFSRLSRKKCTVFFDKAPDNSTREKSYGTLHVIYVTHHTKADEEIIARINKIGKIRAGEITVVSSDRHVQWQCRQAGAAVMESDKFASEMNGLFSNGARQNIKGMPKPHIEPKLNQKEVEAWLEIFNKKPEA